MTEPMLDPKHDQGSGAPRDQGGRSPWGLLLLAAIVALIVGSIPLGGFCKITGMTPDEVMPDDVVPRAYSSKPIWQRNVTIFAGPFMNFVAAVVILFAFIQVGG